MNVFTDPAVWLVVALFLHLLALLSVMMKTPIDAPFGDVLRARTAVQLRGGARDIATCYALAAVCLAAAAASVLLNGSYVLGYLCTGMTVVTAGGAVAWYHPSNTTPQSAAAPAEESASDSATDAGDGPSDDTAAS